MARTDSATVLSILLKEYNDLDNPDLTIFITTANLIVNRIVTCAATKGITLEDDYLTMLEAWLAAHAYGMVDRGAASKTTGSASITFNGKTGMNFEGTPFGQFALGLDYTGCLNSMQTKARAGIFWGGKPESDQLSYRQRN